MSKHRLPSAVFGVLCECTLFFFAPNIFVCRWFDVRNKYWQLLYIQHMLLFISSFTTVSPIRPIFTRMKEHNFLLLSIENTRELNIILHGDVHTIDLYCNLIFAEFLFNCKQQMNERTKKTTIRKVFSSRSVFIRTIGKSLKWQRKTNKMRRHMEWHIWSVTEFQSVNGRFSIWKINTKYSCVCVCATSNTIHHLCKNIMCIKLVPNQNFRQICVSD